MRCEEVRLYVHAFHDGALTADRAVVIVEHVKGCDACRAIYDAEFKLRESARQAYERVVVPERLRGRLLRTLSRSRVRRRLAGALAAAGLLAAAGGAAAWRIGRRPAPDSFVQAALALAQAPVSDALMLGTSDDAAARAELAAYIRDRGARPCLHDLSRIGYVHRAGGVLRDPAPGVRACWTLQESSDGRRLIHVSAPEGLRGAGEGLPPGGVRRIERDGWTVVLVKGCGFL